MRTRLNVETSTLHCITDMMSHFEKIGDDTTKIDPVSLGNFTRILNDATFNIQEILMITSTSLMQNWS